jgi:hypothetical protein
MEFAITIEVWFKKECFEKPCDMGQMPLGGAGVGHRLHALIFRTERGRQQHGLLTHRIELG